MKEKLIAAIKAKHPALNLRTKRLDDLSAKLEAKIKDESEIETILETYSDYIIDMAKADDRVYAAEAKLKALKTPPKEEEKIETGADAPPVDDTPAWAKTLMTEIKQLKADKAQTTIQSQLKEKLKDANPLVNWADWKQPETDEEVTPFIEKVTAKSKELDKTLTEKRLAALAAPKQGTQSPAGTPTVSASLKQTLEAQNKTQQAAVAPANGKSFVINTPGTL